MSENKKKEEQLLELMKFAHFLLSVLLFFIFWFLFRYGSLFTEHDRAFRYNYLVCFAYAVLLYLLNRTYNSYLIGYTRIRTLAFSQFISQAFSAAIVFIFVTLSWAKIRSPFVFLPMLLLQAAADCVWSYYANKYYFSLHPTKRTILVYRNDTDRQRFNFISGKPTERIYRIKETLQYEGDDFHEIEPKLKGYEAVFVAGVNSHCRNGIEKYCAEHDIPGFFLPHIGDVIMRGAEHIQSFTSPVLYVKRKELEPEYTFFKRLFDILASLAGVVILSPLMAVTALAVHLSDGGPALYRQTRLTKDGKRFSILKFRSMVVNAEKDGIAKLSTGEKDSRITPVGKWLRRFRLDELPQLFNILKGDMSFVGPRPERPEIMEKVCEELPEFTLRLQVKAGLTGYAQVYGKYNSEPYEKLEFDLLYINDMNFITDLRLIFATFAILFSKESTEGFEESSEIKDNKNE